jgi:(p)ppGpp synthase/HD superfamily hydrolase
VGVAYETHNVRLDIRDEFGDEVAILVDGASEPEELIHADGGKSKTWPERKAHTIDFIKNAGRDMKLLSCAGKLANIRDRLKLFDFSIFRHIRISKLKFANIYRIMQLIRSIY